MEMATCTSKHPAMQASRGSHSYSANSSEQQEDDRLSLAVHHMYVQADSAEIRQTV